MFNLQKRIRGENEQLQTRINDYYKKQRYIRFLSSELEFLHLNPKIPVSEIQSIRDSFIHFRTEDFQSVLTRIYNLESEYSY